MPNTHVQANTLYEVQTICGDLLSPILLSTTLDVPVPPALTLPPFTTRAFVRQGTPTRLVYVEQSTAAVILAGSDGPYWLAIHHDTHTPVTDWSRQAGTHYLWRSSASQPTTPDGAFIFASVTVAGGVVTALPPLPNPALNRVAYGGVNGQLSYAPQLYWDNAATRLGIGTTAPAMTLHVEGGAQSLGFHVADRSGDNLVAYSSYLNAAGGTNRWHLYLGGTAPSLLGGTLQVSGAVSLLSTLNVAEAVALSSTLSSPSWGSFIGGVNAGGAGGPAGGRKLDVYGDAYLTAHTGLGAVPLPGQYHVNAGSVQVAFLRSADYVYAVNGVDCNILNVRSSGSYIAAYCGIGRAAASGWGLAVSNMYADASVQADNFYARGWTDTSLLNVRSAGSVIGSGNAGYWLNVGNLYSQGDIYGAAGLSIGTCTVRGNVTATMLAVSCGFQPGYYASVYNLYSVAGIYAASLDVVGRINGGTCVIGNNMGIGMEPQPSIHLSLSGSAANKIGGGPWGDSSNRALKRNIAPIENALGLLLAQQGRVYEWAEPAHAAVLPGLRYGFIAEEVTVQQWKTELPEGATVVAAEGFEALTVEALREIVQRLEALERN